LNPDEFVSYLVAGIENIRATERRIHDHDLNRTARNGYRLLSATPSGGIPIKKHSVFFIDPVTIGTNLNARGHASGGIRDVGNSGVARWTDADCEDRGIARGLHGDDLLGRQRCGNQKARNRYSHSSEL